MPSRRWAASACAVVCALAACIGAGDLGTSSAATGTGTPAGHVTRAHRPPLSWGPVKQIAGGVGGPTAVKLPDGTSMMVWSGRRGIISRQARPGRRWQPFQLVPNTYWAGNVWGAGVDAHGTVTIAWDDEEGPNGDYRILAARHRAGGRWSQPSVLGSGPNLDLGLVSVDFAVSESGAVVVVWGEGDGARTRAVYRPPRGDWSAPVTLPGPRWPYIPSAAINPAGLATIAYQHSGGHIALVQDSGAGWGRPILLRAVGSDFAVATGRGSELVLMWRTPRRSIRTARIDHGMWRGHRLVGPVRAYIGGLAAASDGSATFLWVRGGYGGGRNKLVTVHQRRSGELGPRTELFTGPMCDFQWSSNRRGDVLLAWTVSPEFSFADPVRVAYRPRGTGPWSKPITLGTGNDDICLPAAAVGSRGAAVAGWARPTKLLVRRAGVS